MKVQALILSAALAVPTALAAQNTLSTGEGHHLAANDELFLQSLAKEDHSEIDLAKLALQQSKNPQVQQYAHTKILGADPSMEKQAEQVGQQNGEKISDEPTGGQKAEYEKLAHLSRDTFDQAYAKYESQRQQADLIIVENETTTAMNSKVRQFALQEEKPVGEAAQAAKQLAQALHVK